MRRLKLVLKALFYHRFSGTTHLFGTAVIVPVVFVPYPLTPLSLQAGKGDGG